MSDAARVRDAEPNPDPGFYLHEVMTIVVRRRSVDCFGCAARFSPERPTLLTLIDNEPTRPVYAIVAATTILDFLKEADAQGWRKITMYGKTVYICPQCRESHKRSRPEWERRLV